MKIKKIGKVLKVSLFALCLFVTLPVIFSVEVSATDYKYTQIPGTENVTDFQGYLQALYKFAIWGVGIAALLMISVGGFMYFTAAGNTSRAEKAKGVITDAIFGVVAVLLAWMLLYTINPDLLNINISFDVK